MTEKETDERSTEIETEPPLHNMDGKDAFIDWLSPVEVTDILWALALHGSNATSSKDKDEVTLSETASTLRETAYDRLVEWLDEDLNYNDEEPSDQESARHICPPLARSPQVTTLPSALSAANAELAG